jgi:hypothetical protein
MRDHTLRIVGKGISRKLRNKNYPKSRNPSPTALEATGISETLIKSRLFLPEVEDKKQARGTWQTHWRWLFFRCSGRKTN